MAGRRAMPLRIARRSPATERAAVYSYGDLLKDSISLLHRKARANVERMTSGKMSDRELEEIALAPAGGMLKVAGTGKLLAGLLERMATTRKGLAITTPERAIENVLSHRFYEGQQAFKEALKVPEKEYRRIKDIGWSGMRGEALGTKGLYFPREREIALHPRLADIETVWHEFTHARQWNPERFSRLPGGGSEQAASYELQTLLNSLARVAEDTGMSRGQFYRMISPTERHARGVARAAVKFPRDFSTLYKYGLEKEIATSKKKLKEFWGD